MLVAKEKAKTNVGEYLIYMYQIEDLIRACRFNKESIESSLVNQYKVDDQIKTEIRNWYLGLAELMEEEKISESGHLSFITNKINELNDFHLFLLQGDKYADYKKAYKAIEKDLQAFIAKQNKENKNAIELIVNAIYAFYLLRLKKQDISEETTKSIGMFSTLLALLSKYFREYEEGKLKVYD